MTEKRKNGSPRRIQWGLLLVGFALGVLLTAYVMQGRPTTAANQGVSPSEPALWMTATQIIREATATAAAPLAPPTQDPALSELMAAATRIVAGATLTAQAGG